MLDPTLLELLIKFHKKNIKFDIITNVFPRSFPKGQSIEIIKKNIFMDLKNIDDKFTKRTYYFIFL